MKFFPLPPRSKDESIVRNRRAARHLKQLIFKVCLLVVIAMLIFLFAGCALIAPTIHFPDSHEDKKFQLPVVL